MAWVSTVKVETLQVGQRVVEVFWSGLRAFEEPATGVDVQVVGDVVTFRVRRDPTPKWLPSATRDEVTIERRVGEWAKRLVD